MLEKTKVKSPTGHLVAETTYFWVHNPFFLKYFLSLF